MPETTTTCVSRETHARVVKLAAERNETAEDLTSEAPRTLRQDV